MSNLKKRCIKTIFSRTILCAGTMTDFITIKKRELLSRKLNDTESKEKFSTILSCMSKVETKNPTTRFDGVNIEDSVTHIVYIPYDQDIYELDKNSLFVEWEKNKNRNLKLMSSMDYREDYIALFCKETGFVDKEAANG